jgi:hypothetical protein
VRNPYSRHINNLDRTVSGGHHFDVGATELPERLRDEMIAAFDRILARKPQGSRARGR